jgi:hypothetical protein
MNELKRKVIGIGVPRRCDFLQLRSFPRGENPLYVRYLGHECH